MTNNIRKLFLITILSSIFHFLSCSRLGNNDFSLPEFCLVYSDGINLKEFCTGKTEQIILSPQDARIKKYGINYIVSPIKFFGDKCLFIGDSLSSKSRIYLYDLKTQTIDIMNSQTETDKYIGSLSVSPSKNKIAYYQHDGVLNILHLDTNNMMTVNYHLLRGSEIYWLTDKDLIFATSDGICKFNIEASKKDLISSKKSYLVAYDGKNEFLLLDPDGDHNLYWININTSKIKTFEMDTTRSLGDDFLIISHENYLIYSRGLMEQKSTYIFSFAHNKSAWLFGGRFSGGFIRDSLADKNSKIEHK